MIEFILHRANSASQSEIPFGFSGAEIDLRIYLGKVVLAHDPFQDGVTFEDWLPTFTGNFLILNTKETGLEFHLSRIMHAVAPDVEYVFLDLPTPSLVLAARNRLPVAIRMSEYEPLTPISEIPSKLIWVDSFTGSWQHLFETSFSASKSTRKVCLVSPELQGRTRSLHHEEFLKLKNFMRDNSNIVDMICTKERSVWID